jgi:hypothetical protein
MAGLERTDNGMKQTSWPEVSMINQKNYYTCVYTRPTPLFFDPQYFFLFILYGLSSSHRYDGVYCLFTSSTLFCFLFMGMTLEAAEIELYIFC